MNGTRTVDYDCCLTVPLIASAGDRLEIVVQRYAAARVIIILFSNFNSKFLFKVTAGQC